MSHPVLPIRCRSDNYAYLLPGDEGRALLIDAPEAAPIAARLRAEGLRLSHILITHHHHDHVEGVSDLRAGAVVIGAAADAHRLPALDHSTAPGDRLDLAGRRFDVLDAPGHTIGHVAYFEPAGPHLFSADSLMTQGCGRLFEGTPAQMHDTLTRFAALPDATRIWAGHDYAATNTRFSEAFAADPAALAQRKADLERLAQENGCTSGLSLADEKALNPFLRAAQPETAQALGLTGANKLEIFTQLRARRDNF